MQRNERETSGNVDMLLDLGYNNIKHAESYLVLLFKHVAMSLDLTVLYSSIFKINLNIVLHCDCEKLRLYNSEILN